MEKEKIIIFWISLSGLLGLIGIILWHYRHPSREMENTKEGKEKWIKLLYPTAYVCHEFWRKHFPVSFSQEKRKKLHKIYIGFSNKRLEEIYDCQRFMYILVFAILTQGLVILSIFGEVGKDLLKNSYYLARGEPGAGGHQVNLNIKTGKASKEITLFVSERRYRKEEAKAKFAEARIYLQEHYLGQNKSSEKVTTDLKLIKRISGNQINIQWRLDSNGYINKDGSLNNQELKEAVEVVITAVLSYGEEKERVPLQFVICPKQQSLEEQFWQEWNKELEQKEKMTEDKKVMVLPKEVQGKKVAYREIRHPVWPQILFGGVVLCLLIPIFLDYRIEQRIIKREQELRKEYPEIVERFILLIGAGLTIRGAWYRITEDYQQRREKEDFTSTYLYEEMLVTRREMENGQSEATAYAAFGRRLSLLQYMKFSTLLIQNLKKGSDDLLKRMDMEAVDAFRERRETARKLGEEAGTRLLFPMMLMLIIVFAMIMIAAFQNL